MLALGSVTLTSALVALAAGASHSSPAVTPTATHRLAPAVAAPQHVTRRAPAHAAIEAAQVSTGPEDAHLESVLRDRLSHATAGRVGMVVDIDGVGTVAAIGSYLAMMPASTQKLFTTLPLLLHDADRRLVTSVYVGAAPRAGVVHGNLVIHAAGDPSLARPDITALAKRVRAARITRVTGHLVLDIGGLSMRTTQDGWKSDMVPTDVGPLSPYPIRSDQLRHDGWYLSHPTWGNLNITRRLFASAGVRVLGSAQVVRTSNARRLVASHASAPMALLVRHTLRWSDNFWAETLLNVEGGHSQVEAVARDAGVTGTSEATDGSGLSYDDRETVAGELALLRYAYLSSAGPSLVAALPVACRSGTLEHEFCGTVAAGKVFAKTGTLDHAKALAGFTTDARGRLVTFAVLCNAVRDTDAAARAIQRAVVVLRNYAG
jgi:D-alanyl-D-alanine carboxypeptidase/D-alanyl-D-alanine-endopeptidase (penicillin-binding protein 4)